MKELKLIYDASAQSQRFGTMLFPLLFVAVGIAIFLYHKNVVDKKTKSSFGITKRKYGMFFGLLFSAFAGVITCIVILNQNEEYHKTKFIILNKKYKIVEGLVQNYHPMPSGGHDTERFTVDSVQFEYSDFDVTDYGYNNAASNGGAIQDGLFVRISYFKNGSRNVILRLETE